MPDISGPTYDATWLTDPEVAASVIPDATRPDRVTLAEELNPPLNDAGYRRRSAADMARRTAEWEAKYEPPELLELSGLPDLRQDPAFEHDPVLAPPVPLHVAELTEPSPGVDEWLFRNFMRPSTLNVLAASQGIGKSYLRTEIGMRAVTGKGALLGVYETCRRVNVLVLDEDMGILEEWLREEAVARHLGLERAELQGYYRVSFGGVRLDDPRWFAWLDRVVAERDIGLLIFDPISEFYAVKELREELLPIKNGLRSLMRRHPGLSVLVVHHLKKLAPRTKQSDRNLDDVRGALWGQAADMIALMAPLGDRRVGFEVHKRVPPSSLILEQTEHGPFVCVAEAETQERQSSNDERVMDAIDAGDRTIAAVMTATELAERTAWNAIRRLRKSGVLQTRTPFRRTADSA